jgi:mRNA interferase MazF
MSVQPGFGEIWQADLNPTRGHEQQGRRPCLIVSVDTFNSGPADLVIAVPITGTERGIPFHVEIAAPEGGLSKRSFAKCEDVRSISKERLKGRIGLVTRTTMERVKDRLRILMDL